MVDEHAAYKSGVEHVSDPAVVVVLQLVHKLNSLIPCGQDAEFSKLGLTTKFCADSWVMQQTKSSRHKKPRGLSFFIYRGL